MNGCLGALGAPMGHGGVTRTLSSSLPKSDLAMFYPSHAMHWKRLSKFRLCPLVGTNRVDDNFALSSASGLSRSGGVRVVICVRRRGCGCGCRVGNAMSLLLRCAERALKVAVRLGARSGALPRISDSLATSVR